MTIFWIWLAGVIFWSIVVHLPIGGEHHGGSKKWLVFNVVFWPLPTAILIAAMVYYPWQRPRRS
jgi:hypothetical protein